MTLVGFGPFGATGRLLVIGVEGALEDVDAGRGGGAVDP